MGNKLIIVMDEIEGGREDHICHDGEGGCLFYSNLPWTKDTMCKTLWKTPPIGRTSLASLCRYYDTRNVHVIECRDEELNSKIEAIIGEKKQGENNGEKDFESYKKIYDQFFWVNTL